MKLPGHISFPSAVCLEYHFETSSAFGIAEVLKFLFLFLILLLMH